MLPRFVQETAAVLLRQSIPHSPRQPWNFGEQMIEIVNQREMERILNPCSYLLGHWVYSSTNHPKPVWWLPADLHQDGLELHHVVSYPWDPCLSPWWIMELHYLWWHLPCIEDRSDGLYSTIYTNKTSKISDHIGSQQVPVRHPNKYYIRSALRANQLNPPMVLTLWYHLLPPSKLKDLLWTPVKMKAVFALYTSLAVVVQLKVPFRLQTTSLSNLLMRTQAVGGPLVGDRRPGQEISEDIPNHLFSLSYT